MSTESEKTRGKLRTFPMPAEAEELYRRYQPQVYKFLFRMSGDHYLADELTQETFIRALAALPGFRGDALLSTWLYRIARNLFLTHCRQERRTVVEPAEVVTAFLGPHRAGELPEEYALHSEQQELVQLAIQRLDEREREFIVLREISGLTYAEIAEIMGISLGAVKIGLHRARQHFRTVYRQCVAGYEHSPSGTAPQPASRTPSAAPQSGADKEPEGHRPMRCRPAASRRPTPEVITSG